MAEFYNLNCCSNRKLQPSSICSEGTHRVVIVAAATAAGVHVSRGYQQTPTRPIIVGCCCDVSAVSVDVAEVVGRSPSAAGHCVSGSVAADDVALLTPAGGLLAAAAVKCARTVWVVVGNDVVLHAVDNHAPLVLLAASQSTSPSLKRKHKRTDRCFKGRLA